MFRNKLVTVIFALAVFSVGGCAQSKVATVFEKDNSQFALALNKDGTVTVVGVGTGERVKPCEVRAQPLNTQEGGKVGEAPQSPDRAGDIPDDKAIAHCFPDGHVPGKILFEKTYTIGVREGSKCGYVWNGGMLYVYCNPPYPLEFVNKL